MNKFGKTGSCGFGKIGRGREPRFEEIMTVILQVCLVSDRFTLFSLEGVNNGLSEKNLCGQVIEAGIRVPLARPANTRPIEPELVYIMKSDCKLRSKLPF